MDIARIQDFAQKMEDQRQRRKIQELEKGYSNRARSTRQFTASQGDFRPQFPNRPPRLLSSYFVASAPHSFKGLKVTSFVNEMRVRVYE